METKELNGLFWIHCYLDIVKVHIQFLQHFLSMLHTRSKYHDFVLISFLSTLLNKPGSSIFARIFVSSGHISHYSEFKWITTRAQWWLEEGQGTLCWIFWNNIDKRILIHCFFHISFIFPFRVVNLIVNTKCVLLRLTNEYLSHVNVKLLISINLFKFSFDDYKMRIWLKQDFSLPFKFREFFNASSTQWVNHKSCISILERLCYRSIGAAAELKPSYNISSLVNLFFLFLKINAASYCPPMKRNMVESFE